MYLYCQEIFSPVFSDGWEDFKQIRLLNHDIIYNISHAPIKRYFIGQSGFVVEATLNGIRIRFMERAN
jgi:hypothetical protein